MNRSGLGSVFLAFLIVGAAISGVTSASGAKIKFRNTTPTRGAATEEVATPNDAANNPEIADESVEERADDEKEKDAPKEAVRKTPANMGVLIAPTEKKVAADKEREERPVVQDAMRMTLEELVPTKLLRDPRVLRAFARTPRVEFVPKKKRELAYVNSEVPLENGRALESPFNDAYFCEAINPEASDRVLVVEPGVGYFAAVVSELVSETYLVGLDKTQTRRAAPIFKSLGYSNVYVRLGDLDSGWREAAPFDKIVVLGGVSEIPETLLAQLKDGGKLVAPVGDSLRQTVTLCEKEGEELTFRSLLTVSLDMASPFDDKSKAGSPIRLLGGDFEELDPEPFDDLETTPINQRDEASTIKFAPLRATPTGWFDGRLFEIVESDAFEGARACLFDNATTRDEQIKKERKDARLQAATLPEDRKYLSEYGQSVRSRQRETELTSQLRQRVKLDGSSVKKVIFSGAYRLERLGGGDHSVVAARVVFYDKDRRELETRDVLKCASISTEWREFTEEIQVPFRAKSAVVVIGVLEGVGTIRLDALQIRNKSER